MYSASGDLGPNSAKSQNDAKYIYQAAIAVSQPAFCLLSIFGEFRPNYPVRLNGNRRHCREPVAVPMVRFVRVGVFHVAKTRKRTSTESAKPKTELPIPEEIDAEQSERIDAEIGMHLSQDTKQLLLQFLSNAARCVEYNWIHNAAGIGIMAAHLQHIGHYLDSDLREESQFDNAYEGKTRDKIVNCFLQMIPDDFVWKSPWPEILEETGLLFPDSERSGHRRENAVGT
ncbi:MAG TPA: hypothetical protein VM260_26585 [Pirellula sp.]|nr:hypothetical protein [Pirellula sp.]